MNSKDPRGNLSRRSILSGIGAGAMASFAGCIRGENPFTNPQRFPDVREVSQVQLERIPDSVLRLDKKGAVASPDLYETLTLLQNQQIRISRPGETFGNDFLSAAYSVRNKNLPNKYDGVTNTIWLSSSGLNRINASPGWKVSVSRNVPSADIESKNLASRNREIIEQYIDGEEDEFIFIAPHGGEVMPNTENQAIRVANELDADAWVTLGYNGGKRSYERWYVPDEYMHLTSYPELAKLVDYQTLQDNPQEQFEPFHQEATSFNGFDGKGVIIGGLASDKRKNRIYSAIDEKFRREGIDENVRISRSGPNSATESTVLVNWITENHNAGLRLLQSKDVTEKYWKVVADAVIEAYRDSD